MTVESIIISFMILWIITIMYLWVRLDKAANLLHKMLEQTGQAARLDLRAGIFDWEWRFERLKEVSLFALTFKIWLRLDPEVFWKDLSFLYPTERSKECFIHGNVPAADI